LGRETERVIASGFRKMQKGRGRGTMPGQRTGAGDGKKKGVITLKEGDRREEGNDSMRKIIRRGKSQMKNMASYSPG